MSLTTDPQDPRLGHGADTEPQGQHDVYLVLSEEERTKGFARPLYRSYIHHDPECGAVTRMGLALCETYARDPSFYGATYCVGCRMHRPVGKHGEFTWLDEHGNDTHVLVGTLWASPGTPPGGRGSAFKRFSGVVAQPVTIRLAVAPDLLGRLAQRLAHVLKAVALIKSARHNQAKARSSPEANQQGVLIGLLIGAVRFEQVRHFPRHPFMMPRQIMASPYCHIVYTCSSVCASTWTRVLLDSRHDP